MYEVQDIFTFDTGTRQRSSERLTPYKFTVMCLAFEYHQLLKLQNKDLNISLPDEQVLTESCKRNFMCLLLDLLQKPDMELKSIPWDDKTIINPSISEAVCNTLVTIAQQGVKPMQDFLETLITQLMVSATAPVDEGEIRRDSIMGLYVRRMLLAYHEMSFSQIVELYHKVKDYYEAGFPETKEYNMRVRQQSSLCFRDTGPLTLMHLEPKPDPGPDEGPLDGVEAFSKKQAEYFMAHQAQMLGHNKWKAELPDYMQRYITNILKANPDMAEAHFLSYMNNLRVNEYCLALHSLYHYFDCKTSMPGEGATTSKKKSASMEEVALRYAALNLASLQYRFGNKEECKAALQEAIMLAQEGNDQVCLQHALVWLNLLGENHTGVTQLERSIKKTIDLSLPHLTVHGLNCLNKDLGMGTEIPARVIYYFTQSNLINCMHSSYGQMASGCAQRAAMWQHYGKRELCSLDSHIVLQLDTSINGVYYNGQAVCIAMCNLAQHHADLGDYAAANEIFARCKEQFPMTHSESNVWQACQQRIAFMRALYNGRLREAEQALINLQALDEREAKIRKAMLLREKGQVTEAFDCLTKLLSECEKEKSDMHANFHCRVLLELSSLFISRGHETQAILHVTDCIARAARHHLELLEALGIAHLAYVQHKMGIPRKAVSLLKSRLLRIYTHASSFDKARVLHLYAHCKVAKARSGGPVHKRRGWSEHAELQSTASLMEKVAQLFHDVEAHLREKDSYHFTAMIHHHLGHKQNGGPKVQRQHHMEERNRCARQFKTLDKLYPTLNFDRVSLL